jgi:hypothetical protein
LNGVADSLSHLLDLLVIAAEARVDYHQHGEHDGHGDGSLAVFLFHFNVEGIHRSAILAHGVLAGGNEVAVFGGFVVKEVGVRNTDRMEMTKRVHLIVMVEVSVHTSTVMLE